MGHDAEKILDLFDYVVILFSSFCAKYRLLVCTITKDELEKSC